ncbi:glycine betaine ABC transporter, putative [Babesia ovis]|uniref:Glycine betaine ABC transporter, putative n=1 Tax=Babesia ovis TaxID=5869 RepID=A0A9W5T9Q6_BABOV|nr:glycine betaine ABC transporter, putative [Babesia ovis]
MSEAARLDIWVSSKFSHDMAKIGTLGFGVSPAGSSVGLPLSLDFDTVILIGLVSLNFTLSELVSFKVILSELVSLNVILSELVSSKVILPGPTLLTPWLDSVSNLEMNIEKGFLERCGGQWEVDKWYPPSVVV